MSSKNKNNNGGGKPGKTVEDAAKALKQNQDGGNAGSEGSEETKAGEDAGQGEEQNGNTETQGGENQSEGSSEEKGNDGSEDGGNAGSEEAGTNAGGSEGSEETKAEPAKKATKIPMPTASEIQQSAAVLAENPQLFEACSKTLELAKKLIAQKKLGPKKSVEELAAATHERLVNTYGKDFVTATRGTNQAYFSRLAWNGMGKTKSGWIEKTKEMPEVAATTEASEVK